MGYLLGISQGIVGCNAGPTYPYVINPYQLQTWHQVLLKWSMSNGARLPKIWVMKTTNPPLGESNLTWITYGDDQQDDSTYFICWLKNDYKQKKSTR